MSEKETMSPISWRRAREDGTFENVHLEAIAFTEGRWACSSSRWATPEDLRSANEALGWIVVRSVDHDAQRECQTERDRLRGDLEVAQRERAEIAAKLEEYSREAGDFLQTAIENVTMPMDARLREAHAALAEARRGGGATSAAPTGGGSNRGAEGIVATTLDGASLMADRELDAAWAALGVKASEPRPGRLTDEVVRLRDRAQQNAQAAADRQRERDEAETRLRGATNTLLEIRRSLGTDAVDLVSEVRATRSRADAVFAARLALRCTDDASLTVAIDQVRQRAEKAEAKLTTERAAAMGAEEQRDEAKGRARRATQAIVECIGSVGPEDADDAAARIVATVDDLRAKLGKAEASERTTYANLIGKLTAIREALGVPEDADAVEYVRTVTDDMRNLRARLAAARHQPTEPRATEEELVRVFNAAVAESAAALGFTPTGSRDTSAEERAGLRALATRVRAERPACLVERAVRAGYDIRVVEAPIDGDGGWLVGVHTSSDTEEATRNVPPSDVPATLDAMLREVGA